MTALNPIGISSYSNGLTQQPDSSGFQYQKRALTVPSHKFAGWRAGSEPTAPNKFMNLRVLSPWRTLVVSGFHRARSVSFSNGEREATEIFAQPSILSGHGEPRPRRPVAREDGASFPSLSASIAERGYAFRDVRRGNPGAVAGLSPSRSRAESGEQALECVMVVATRRTRASLASNVQASWRAKK